MIGWTQGPGKSVCGQWVLVDRKGMGLVPTGPKNVVDNVDDLLMGDVTSTSSGALLIVLQEGACDVLNVALWGHKLGASWHFQVGPCPSPHGSPTGPPGS